MCLLVFNFSSWSGGQYAENQYLGSLPSDWLPTQLAQLDRLAPELDGPEDHIKVLRILNLVNKTLPKF